MTWTSRVMIAIPATLAIAADNGAAIRSTVGFLERVLDDAADVDVPRAIEKDREREHHVGDELHPPARQNVRSGPSPPDR